MEIVRKATNGLKADEAVERILDLFRHTRNNREFMAMVEKMKYKKTLALTQSLCYNNVRCFRKMMDAQASGHRNSGKRGERHERGYPS